MGKDRGNRARRRTGNILNPFTFVPFGARVAMFAAAVIVVLLAAIAKNDPS